MEQTSPPDWVPVDSLAWYGGREVFLGSAECCRGGSLLCDRELSRCITWLVPHRERSPGCLWSGSSLVQDGVVEKQCSPLLRKG